jgi:hypothetical protein
MIVDTLLEHAKLVYEENMVRKSKTLIGKKKVLVEKLPAGEFAKSDFLEISESIGIIKPTAEKYLKDLKALGKIVKLDHALYKKAA